MLAEGEAEQVIARNGGLFCAEERAGETYIGNLAREPARAQSKWKSNPGQSHGDDEVLHGFLWRAILRSSRQ